MAASAKFQIIADVKDAVDNIKRLESQFGVMEKVNKDAAGALKTFGVDLDALSNPITLVAQGMKAAIDETVKWAGDIDKLSRNTGLSTEEASKLAIVAGDVGIEMGTLERALKKMNKEGLELNIDTLKKVSKEYNATNDPVERLRIATKSFGAAAQDMTEILSRSPEELDALANAAERSGRVMDEEAVANAEKFEQSLAQLNDTVKGVMVTIGNVAIPTLLRAGETLQTEAKIAAVLAIEFQRLTGQIDYNEASQRAAEVAAGNLGAAFQEQIPIIHEVNERVTDTTYSELMMTSQTAALNSVWQSYVPTVSDAVAVTYDVAAAQEQARLQEEIANSVYGTAIGLISTSNLQDGEKLRLLQALKIASGELTIEEIARENAVNNLTQAYIDGDITQQQYMDGLTEIATQGEVTSVSLGGTTTAVHTAKEAMILAEDAAIALAEAENALPTGGSFHYTITWDQEALQQLQSEVNSLPGEINGTVGGAVGDGYSQGTNGWETVPPGYPRDTYPIRLTSGEQFAVIPNNVTNNYNMSITTPAPYNIGGALGRQRALAGAY